MILFWNFKYLSHAHHYILALQDRSLPSCEHLIMPHIRRSIFHSLLSPQPKDVPKSAEILVYNIALNIVDSPQPRLIAGNLSDEGKQLLHICRRSIKHFLRSGYITCGEYKECWMDLHFIEHHFEQYTSLP